MVVTAGAIAEGGGDFTVVVEVDVDSDTLLLVESVTIGSAAKADVEATTRSAAKMFLNMMVLCTILPILLTFIEQSQYDI
jgi:hypothetical protein